MTGLTDLRAARWREVYVAKLKLMYEKGLEAVMNL